MTRTGGGWEAMGSSLRMAGTAAMRSGEAMREGRAAAARRGRRSGGAASKRDSAASRRDAERSDERSDGRRVEGDGDESANGRSSSSSGGEPAASARRRTGKMDARSGEEGGVAARKKESLEAGGSAGWRRMCRWTGSGSGAAGSSAAGRCGVARRSVARRVARSASVRLESGVAAAADGSEQPGWHACCPAGRRAALRATATAALSGGFLRAQPRTLPLPGRERTQWEWGSPGRLGSTTTHGGRRVRRSLSRTVGCDVRLGFIVKD